MFDFKIRFSNCEIYRYFRARIHDVYHDYDVTEGKSIFFLLEISLKGFFLWNFFLV